MSSPSLQTDAPVRPRSLWRNRDYMLLWSGQVVSSVGTQASTLAFPLLILAVTHSPAQAGFASALRALPYLFFSLPAGALIDRWNRKRVMILCDTGRAIALGSIPIALAFGALTVVQIYAVSLIEGSLYVFFNIAEAACLPRVVPKEQLPAATAQNQVTDGVSSLTGPPLGGALFGIAQALPFLADAISYVVSVASLFFIRAQFQGERTASTRKLREQIGEGLSWLWHHPLIRFIAFLTGVANLTGNGTFLLVIFLAKEQHASAFATGLIFTIGSVGGIAGSILAVAIQKRFTFAQVIITSGWMWFLLTPLYAFAPNPLLLGVISAGFFVTSPIYNVVQFSYRLALIPDELQGRVNSVFRLIAFGGQPIGYALAGVLAQAIGPSGAVLLFAAPLLLAAILTTINPHVRNAKPLAEVQAG